MSRETLEIKAIIHESEEGGFWAEFPALRGCSTQGETSGELTKSLKDAIALWFDVGEDEIEPQSTDRILELAM